MFGFDGTTTKEINEGQNKHKAVTGIVIEQVF